MVKATTTGGTRHPPAPSAVRGSLPDSQAPQLCSTASDPPSDDAWLTELKFDGYRLLAAVNDGVVRLLTRNGLDWTDRMPAVSAAIAALGLRNAMLDGELVALQPDGVSSFPMLQAALKAGRDGSLVFYAFDLLHLDGWDLRGCKLLDRKRVLEGAARWDGAVRYSGHVVGQAVEIYRSAGRMKLEGIICKRAQAPYRSGRSGDWLKVKCLGREELIVLGWTTPTRSRVGLGARYSSATMIPKVSCTMQVQSEQGLPVSWPPSVSGLTPCQPLHPAPAGLLVADGEPIDPATHWVRPELVAEVKYTGWSGAGRVRHACTSDCVRTKLPARLCERWRIRRRLVWCSRPSLLTGQQPQSGNLASGRPGELCRISGPAPDLSFSKVVECLVFRNRAIRNSYEKGKCLRAASGSTCRGSSETLVIENAQTVVQASNPIGSQCEHDRPLASTAR